MYKRMNNRKLPDSSHGIKPLYSKWYLDYSLLYYNASTNKNFDDDFADLARNHLNSLKPELGNFLTKSIEVAGLNSETSFLEVLQVILKAKAIRPQVGCHSSKGL